MRTFARKMNLRMRSIVAAENFARQYCNHAARMRQQIYERQHAALRGGIGSQQTERCRSGGCVSFGHLALQEAERVGAA